MRRKAVETFKRPQAVPQLSGRPDRIDDESNGFSNARARNRELEMPIVMSQQDMMVVIARQQDRCAAWQRRQVKRPDR